MKTAFILALTKMGYRQPDTSINPLRWAKPVAHDIFIADIIDDVLSLRLYFKAPGNGQFLCWSSVEIRTDVDTPIDLQIADFERYTDFHGYQGQTYGFLTRAQTLEQVIG